MNQWRRRIGLAILALVTVVVGYTMIYQWAMATYEGVELSFSHSMRVVIESLTTAGFGGDTDYWTTVQSDLLVLTMNLSGVLLVFLAIPLFAVPMFREAFYTRPPESSDLTDHVIICGYSHRDEILCAELETAGIPYLYIDSDPEVVRSLNDREVAAIVGDSERVETLKAANIEAARAVVADVNDEVNPTVILAAKRANPGIKVLSVARRSVAAEYHRYAGADEVIEAPRVLGESLGLRAITSFAEQFREALGNGGELEVTELLVEEGSDLIGKTLRETDLFEEHGVRVFGGWFGGKFLIPPDPDIEIAENTILLVAGQYEFDEATTRQLPPHLDDRSRILICGHGVVGQAAAEMIESQGLEYDVIDIDPNTDPDFIGDVTDPQTFLNADVEEYRSVILALNRDPTTIYAALVLWNVAPDVEIIARVHDPDNVWKLYGAGADFVLSMSDITGELLAAELIEEVDIFTPHDDFEFARADASPLAGQTTAESDVRSETGATIVAVLRDDRIITNIGPEFEFREHDELVLAGRPDAIDRYQTRFG